MAKKTLITLSQRLSHALQMTNTTQTELANRINVKKQAIQYLCSCGADRSKFSYDIAHALNIDVDWLITGNGEMTPDESLEKKLLAEQKIVPVLQWGQINTWLINKIDKSLIVNWSTVHEKFGEKTFALGLKDNSMFPRFDSNTLIIIDPHKAPSPPCFIIVYIEKIREIVFRQLISENNKLVLYPFNEAGYKQLLLSKDDKILGCMVEAKWFA